MPGPDDLGAYFAQQLITQDILALLKGQSNANPCPAPRLPAPEDSESPAPPQ